MREQINSTTYGFRIPSGDMIEVGDIKSADFKPHAKLNRWGNECSMSIGLPTIEKVLPVVEGEKLKWKGKDEEINFYPLDPESDKYELGGFEFEIILKRKPKSNIQTLSFNSDNLKFYYQPPLTQEFKAGWSEEFQCEIEVTETTVTNKATRDILVHRPEKVVGSYAVYHATKTPFHKSNAEAEKYKTCQAFMWYRPLIWDSSVPRKECWGELNVDQIKGTRTVTIPQDFIDNAVYPVTIDDNFGYETMGQNTVSFYLTAVGSWFEIPSSGVAESITAYLEGGGASQGRAAIYSYVADNDAGVLVGSTELIDPVAGWNTMNFAVPKPELTIGTKYFLMMWANGSGISNGIRCATESAKGITKAQSTSTYPSSLTGEAGNNNKYSIYCTYEPGGGGEVLWGSATLSGLGTLAAIGQAVLSGKALLSGIGSLATGGLRVRYGSAPLSGAGTLVAVGKAILSGKALLSGVGSLASSGLRARYSTASLNGTGILTAAVSVALSGKALLSGVGTLAAVGKAILSGKALLSGTGLLSTSGLRTRYGATSFNGVGTLATVGQMILSGKALLGGAGSLIANGLRTRYSATSFNGVGSLAVIGQMTLSGKALLNGVGSLAISGLRTRYGLVTLSGVGTLATTAQRVLHAAATLSGIGTLTVLGTKALYGIATLAGSGMLAVIAYLGGWTGKISGVTNPASIIQVPKASIKSVRGVT